LIKLKLSLSKATIEKLSTADTNAVCLFLKNLKTVIDEFEHEKQLEFEKSQYCPLYIIFNEDMIQVSGIQITM